MVSMYIDLYACNVAGQQGYRSFVTLVSMPRHIALLSPGPFYLFLPATGETNIGHDIPIGLIF